MVDEPKGYVLDSFALLAYFGNEPGAETVEQLLGQAQNQTVTLQPPAVTQAQPHTAARTCR